MDAKTYRHHTAFPLLAATSDEALLDVALSLLPASLLEDVLQRQARGEEDRTIAPLIEQMSQERLQQAHNVLFPKTGLKTHPIIARETGRVFRAQGRPPKETQPIYVDTEAEALRLLSQN